MSTDTIRSTAPNLKTYLEKRVHIQIHRPLGMDPLHVVGRLNGFDQFMNLVLEEMALCDQDGEILETSGEVKQGHSVIRGSSVVQLEVLDKY